MTPKEALIPERFEQVLSNKEKYLSEFGRGQKNVKKFNIGDAILIKSEVRKSKQDKLFKLKAKVTAIMPNNTYGVMADNGKSYIRHIKQIKEDRNARNVVLDVDLLVFWYPDN